MQFFKKKLTNKKIKLAKQMRLGFEFKKYYFQLCFLCAGVPSSGKIHSIFHRVKGAVLGKLSDYSETLDFDWNRRNLAKTSVKDL